MKKVSIFLALLLMSAVMMTSCAGEEQTDTEDRTESFSESEIIETETADILACGTPYTDLSEETEETLLGYVYQKLDLTPGIGKNGFTAVLGDISLLGEFDNLLPEKKILVLRVGCEYSVQSMSENGCETDFLMILSDNGAGELTLLAMPDLDNSITVTQVRTEAEKAAEIAQMPLSDSITDIDEFSRLRLTSTQNYGCLDRTAAVIRSLIEGDTAVLEHLGYNIEPGTYDVLSTVKIASDYKIYTEKRSEYWELLLFSFTVLESELDTLPSGDYVKMIESGLAGTIITDYPAEDSDVSPAVGAVQNWLASCGDIVPHKDNSGIGDYIGCFYGNELTDRKFDELASLMFGIEDCSMGSMLRYDEASGFYYVPGHGGRYRAYRITDEKTESDGSVCVTVEFYEDFSRFIPAMRVEFELAELTELGLYDGVRPYWSFESVSIIWESGNDIAQMNV